eukprot:scaffold10715_cov114-Isochrysis_galbana.AAC.11
MACGSVGGDVSAPDQASSRPLRPAHESASNIQLQPQRQPVRPRGARYPHREQDNAGYSMIPSSRSRRQEPLTVCGCATQPWRARLL